jgi:Mrp family chromosome partitioning ATPase
MDELEKIKNMTPEEQQAYLESLQACEHNCSTCSQECGSKVKKPAKVVVVITGGKGGTGKSVMSVLLAKAIQKQNASVAILDADIAGATVPALLGMTDPVLGDMPELAPVSSASGIGVVSMGIIVEDALEPVLWPGKDMAKLAVWLLKDTKWPEGLDVLLIDMPSGAGDIPLEYYTTMPLDYALAVAEPGETGSAALRRSINLADMLRVPVMGIVENFAQEDMSLAKSCETIPVVASVPYDSALRSLASQGKLDTYETDKLDYLARAILELR